MKHLFTSIIFVLMIVTANAQDLIVKRDQTKVEAVVMEVSESEVRYKSFTNLEGPTFVLKTEQISSIIFQNGDVLVFEHKDNKDSGNSQMSIEGTTILLDDSEKSQAFNYYKKYTTIGRTGVCLTALGAAFVVAGIIMNNDVGKIMLISGGISAGIGVPLCCIGYIKRNKAYKIYNDENTALNNRNKRIDFMLQASSDGFGVAMRF